MPATLRYEPDFYSDAGRIQEDKFFAERRERRRFIENNMKYYKGDHKKHLKRDSTGTDDNVTINLIEAIVDKDISRVMGIDDRGEVRGLDFNVVDRPGELQSFKGFFDRAITLLRPRLSNNDSPEQVYLDDVWSANNKDVLIIDAFNDGSLTGHVFLKLEENARESLVNPGVMLPRITVLNPEHLTVFWDAFDAEQVIFYRIEWSDGETSFRQDIVHAPEREAWDIYEYQRSGTLNNRWEGGYVDTWNYNFPPILDWKNLPNPHDYYGKDDVRGLRNLNDSLNFTASNMQRILKHHAHPKTIGLGMKPGDVKLTDIDQFWTVPVTAKDALIKNLEMQSDLRSSLDFVNLLKRFIYDLGRELDPSSVHEKLGDVTNFGLRVLYADPLAKSGVKRLLAEQALIRLNLVLLELGGFQRREILIDWPDPLPSDPLQMAQALQIVAQHGLSWESFLEVMGFDPEQEVERRMIQREEVVEDALIKQQAGLVGGLLNGAKQQAGWANGNPSTRGGQPGRRERPPEPE